MGTKFLENFSIKGERILCKCTSRGRDSEKLQEKRHSGRCCCFNHWDKYWFWDSCSTPKNFSCGGTKATDQVNQWLTTLMIGLLVAIEVLTILYGGWSGDEGSSHWGKVQPTIPVLIFYLVYHDLASGEHKFFKVLHLSFLCHQFMMICVLALVAVLCAYLEGDLKRIRASVLIGGLVPLLALLVWDAIAFGLSSQVDQVVDPVELLLRVKWSGVSYMVQAFSLLVVRTSLIGTLLSFSEFLKEQLNNLDLQPDVSTRSDLQRSNSQLRL